MSWYVQVTPTAVTITQNPNGKVYGPFSNEADAIDIYVLFRKQIDPLLTIEMVKRQKRRR